MHKENPIVELFKHNRIQVTKKEMPTNECFVCFDDDDVKLWIKFNWSRGTIVESIDFTLENKPGKNFELHEPNGVEGCEENGLPYFRMNIITNPDPTPNLEMNLASVDLGMVDMAEGNYIAFIFNLITKEEIENYDGNCDFSDGPEHPIIIKSKDGSVVMSKPHI